MFPSIDKVANNLINFQKLKDWTVFSHPSEKLFFSCVCLGLFMYLLGYPLFLSFPSCEVCQQLHFEASKDVFCPLLCICPLGGGRGTLNFKWWGWSNGYKNQNPKKSLDQKLTPPPPHQKKKSQVKFPNLPNFQIALKWYNTKNKLEFEFLCLQAGFSNTTNNLRIVLNTQQFPYLSQATKKILTKFSYAKKILE